MEDKKNKENDSKIEVVIGDETVLDISKVGDYVNTLRPKSSEKNKKKVIIPIEKKKNDKK